MQSANAFPHGWLHGAQHWLQNLVVRKIDENHVEPVTPARHSWRSNNGGVVMGVINGALYTPQPRITQEHDSAREGKPSSPPTASSTSSETASLPKYALTASARSRILRQHQMAETVHKEGDVAASLPTPSLDAALEARAASSHAATPTTTAPTPFESDIDAMVSSGLEAMPSQTSKTPFESSVDAMVSSGLEAMP
ncbi:MAG: hypothetical protein ACRYF5_14700, partial [Janthinobacterium lividum]